MTTTVAIVAPCAVIAFALWLEDRRRRERDADLIGEVRACRREVQALTALPRADLGPLLDQSRADARLFAEHADTPHFDLPDAWKDTP